MRLVLGLVLALVAAPAATAGPPFRTDDPVPVEPHHWEIFLFSAGTHAAGSTSGILPGIDANYGAVPNLQLHTALPIAFNRPPTGSAVFGIGDGELGAKYRFLSEDEQGWRPQAAIYPAVDFPTGDASRGLGTGHTRVFLPVWIQKTFRKWITYGGVGYWINPGADNRNFWYAGWTVQTQVTEHFTLGAEMFHQTADTVSGKDQTGFDLGAVYDLSEHYHLMLSLGQGLQNRNTTNQFSYYAAIQFTF